MVLFCNFSLSSIPTIVVVSSFSFDELLELSYSGNNRVIDMLVGDIYGGMDYSKVFNALSIVFSIFFLVL